MDDPVADKMIAQQKAIEQFLYAEAALRDAQRTCEITQKERDGCRANVEQKAKTVVALWCSGGSTEYIRFQGNVIIVGPRGVEVARLLEVSANESATTTRSE